jgi:hypothetical protein
VDGDVFAGLGCFLTTLCWVAGVSTAGFLTLLSLWLAGVI